MGDRSQQSRQDGRSRSRERVGIVLDEYEDLCDAGRHKNENAQIIYVIGTSNFTLLKIYIRPRLRFEIGQEIVIPKLRNRTFLIKRQVLGDISTIAQQNVFEIIDKIIVDQEKKFVDFFNEARTLTPRLHQLKLLPGIGPKRMWDILEERKKQKFTSFQDIIERTEINDPISLIRKRILEELEGNQKYYLFVASPPRSAR